MYFFFRVLGLSSGYLEVNCKLLIGRALPFLELIAQTTFDAVIFCMDGIRTIFELELERAGELDCHGHPLDVESDAKDMALRLRRRHDL